MSTKISEQESDISYLFARDPSIVQPVPRFIRQAPLVPIQLHQLFEQEELKLPKQSWQNIFLRIKPSTPHLNAQGCPFVVLNNTTLLIKDPKQIGKSIAHHYTFTKIFGPTVEQQELYLNTCLDSMRDFISGRNCLLFAYGATNAGKTHTIQGNLQNPGVIPQSINALFNAIKGKVSLSCRYKPDKVSTVVELDEGMQQQELKYKKMIFRHSFHKNLTSSSKSTLTQMSQESLAHKVETTVSSVSSDFISTTFQDMKKNFSVMVIDVNDPNDIVYSVWVSFSEIYNEYIYDLLDVSTQPKKRKQLNLGESYQKDVYIKGLRSIFVTSGDEAYQVFLFGQMNLQMAPTNINHTSSRSHSIFTIKLIRHVNTNNPSFARVSMFSFVDLAGAERAKKTCNIGERMKESQNINTSLHVLGRCLETIRSNQRTKDKRIIPFRDSKLTRLFQRALSGKDKINMIVNVNSSGSSYEETVNVLKFSAIAKQIVFEHVAEPKRHALRTSRFSQITMQSYNTSKLRNGLSRDGILEPLPSSLGEKSSSSSQCQSLLMIIEKLRQQLREQQQVNATLERDVRQELYEKSSALLVQIETTWNNRLKASEERMEELADWRINKLQDYYETRTKRRRCDCQTATYNSRVQELEEDVVFLEQKVENLEQLLIQSRDTQNKLQARNSQLQFEVASLKLELQDKGKLLEAKELCKSLANAEHDPFAIELRRQLNVTLELVKKKDGEIEDVKGLLKEAQEDFILHIKTEEDSDKKAEELERQLILKDEELEELRAQLAESHILTAQHAAVLEKEGQTYEAQQKLLEDLDGYKLMAARYESQTKNLEKENEKLHSIIGKRVSKSFNFEMQALEAQVLGMQDEMRVCKDKLKVSEVQLQELESKLPSDAAAISFIDQDILKKEIVMHQEEIKTLLQTKMELQEKLLTKTNEGAAVEEDEKGIVKMLHMADQALQQETVSMEAENIIFKTQLKLDEDRLKQENELEKCSKMLQERLQNINLNDTKRRPRRTTRIKTQDKNPSQASIEQEVLDPGKSGDSKSGKGKVHRRKLFNPEEELEIESVNVELPSIPVKPRAINTKRNRRRHQM